MTESKGDKPELRVIEGGAGIIDDLMEKLGQLQMAGKGESEQAERILDRLEELGVWDDDAGLVEINADYLSPDNLGPIIDFGLPPGVTPSREDIYLANVLEAVYDQMRGIPCKLPDKPLTNLQDHRLPGKIVAFPSPRAALANLEPEALANYFRQQLTEAGIDALFDSDD